MPFLLYTALPVGVSNWLLFHYLEKVHAYYGKTWFERSGDQLKVNQLRKKIWLISANACSLLLILWVSPGPALATTIFLCSLSMAISEMDMSYHIIPDRFQIMGLFVSLGELSALYYTDQSLPWGGLFMNLLFWGVLFLTGLIYHKFRNKDGIGMGDLKLLFWMALALPDSYVPAFFIGIISSLTGQFLRSIFAKNPVYQDPFALGPYLVFGLMTMKIWPLVFHT